VRWKLNGGKVVHLGELLPQKGMGSKEDLIAAMDEVTTVPYVDCASLQIPADALKAIPAAMARLLIILPIKLDGNKLTVAMAEPQNLRVIDELRFKTGKEIVPRLGFKSELREAVDKHYGPEEMSSAENSGEHTTLGVENMEFISSSAQQRNVKAMREMQAELSQKSKTTPAVMESPTDEPSEKGEKLGFRSSQ
jgi:hypothetical protein